MSLTRQRLVAVIATLIATLIAGPGLAVTVFLGTAAAQVPSLPELPAVPVSPALPAPPEPPAIPAELDPVLQVAAPVTTYVCVTQSSSSSAVVVVALVGGLAGAEEAVGGLGPWLFLPSAVCRLPLAEPSVCGPDEQAAGATTTVREQLDAAVATAASAAAGVRPEAALAGFATQMVSVPSLPKVGAVVDVTRLAEQLVASQSGQPLPASVADTVAAQLACHPPVAARAGAPSVGSGSQTIPRSFPVLSDDPTGIGLALGSMGADVYPSALGTSVGDSAFAGESTPAPPVLDLAGTGEPASNRRSLAWIPALLLVSVAALAWFGFRPLAPPS